MVTSRIRHAFLFYHFIWTVHQTEYVWFWERICKNIWRSFSNNICTKHCIDGRRQDTGNRVDETYVKRKWNPAISDTYAPHEWDTSHSVAWRDTFRVRTGELWFCEITQTYFVTTKVEYSKKIIEIFHINSQRFSKVTLDKFKSYYHEQGWTRLT